VDRGYLISPETEREIWERIFKIHLKINPSDCGLMLVDPLFHLPSTQRVTDELVFEDFGFQSLCVGNAPVFTHAYQAHKKPTSLLARSKCSLVVDSGFSFTHAAPVFQNRVVSGAVKRINLGGKALTNYLKELVSYRAWNVMDETYIMEDVKEKLCFCSLDIVRDLTIARSVYSPGLFWSPCILMGLNSFCSILAVPELLGL
jgi:actin-related protein 6